MYVCLTMCVCMCVTVCVYERQRERYSIRSLSLTTTYLLIKAIDRSSISHSDCSHINCFLSLTRLQLEQTRDLSITDRQSMVESPFYYTVMYNIKYATTTSMTWMRMSDSDDESDRMICTVLIPGDYYG